MEWDPREGELLSERMWALVLGVWILVFFFFFLAGPAGINEVASESNFFSLMEKMDVNVPCNLRKLA